VRLPHDRLRGHGHAGGLPDGHSKVETTKNIYGHLFAQDRADVLAAMNQAVSRLHAYDDTESGEVAGQAA